jgi:hypothetical protein
LSGGYFRRRPGVQSASVLRRGPRPPHGSRPCTWRSGPSGCGSMVRPPLQVGSAPPADPVCTARGVTVPGGMPGG